jgi:hypothetical protein
MKKLILCIALLLGVPAVYAQQWQKTQEEVCYNPNSIQDTTKKSINSLAIGVIGQDTIKISYHSPGVRGRIIWGGLVSHDEVWVTGAHNATTLTLRKPILIKDKEIPAGKYAVFTIPGKDEWTVIINKHWDQHLTNEYDQKDDVLRFNVRPEKNKHTERLQYFIDGGKQGTGTIAVAWEKVKVQFPFVMKS